MTYYIIFVKKIKIIIIKQTRKNRITNDLHLKKKRTYAIMNFKSVIEQIKLLVKCPSLIGFTHR